MPQIGFSLVLYSGDLNDLKQWELVVCLLNQSFTYDHGAFLKTHCQAVVAHAFTPSTLEAEVGGPLSWRPAGLFHRETPLSCLLIVLFLDVTHKPLLGVLFFLVEYF